jgi:hypothetical protein
MSQFGIKNVGLRDKWYLRYACDNEVASAASGETQYGDSDVIMFNQSGCSNISERRITHWAQYV